MSRAVRTFRLFVSSTFSDLKAERDALQRYVFPRLRDLCARHGTRFQAIDLRWGVSEEAALDQQTIEICLDEIARCRRLSPRPNFIVLLGDRYGWRPLPPRIAAEEFGSLLSTLSIERQELMRTWYRRDDNATPAEYRLRPREGAFEDIKAWSEVERKLLHALTTAAAGSLALDPERRAVYGASATEQEIAAGALLVGDASQHVYGFFRTLQCPSGQPIVEDLPTDAAIQEFIDLEETGHVDRDAHLALVALKQRLREHLPLCISEYEAVWTGGGISTVHLGTLPDDLDACLALTVETSAKSSLCVDVWQRLSRVILDEIQRLGEVDPLDLEVAEHTVFGDERSRGFVGRTAALERIARYLRSEDDQLLAIVGEAGVGKSALLGRAAIESANEDPSAVVIRRFIGATPESSDIRALLRGLCEEITRRFGLEHEGVQVGAVDNTLVEVEPYASGDVQALATLYESTHERVPADRKLVLFIDALDQLSDIPGARDLFWLPPTLPSKVRLIVSVLPGDCLIALERRVSSEQIQQIERMLTEEGRTVLQGWLTESGRRLRPDSEMAGFGSPESVDTSGVVAGFARLGSVDTSAEIAGFDFASLGRPRLRTAMPAAFR